MISKAGCVWLSGWGLCGWTIADLHWPKSYIVCHLCQKVPGSSVGPLKSNFISRLEGPSSNSPLYVLTFTQNNLPTGKNMEREWEGGQKNPPCKIDKASHTPRSQAQFCMDCADLIYQFLCSLNHWVKEMTLLSKRVYFARNMTTMREFSNNAVSLISEISTNNSKSWRLQVSLYFVKMK